MCIFRDGNVIAAITGGLIAGLAGYICSMRVIKKTRTLNALDKFVENFIAEILFIEDAVPQQDPNPDGSINITPASNICDSLLNARDKHRKAIEVFSLYVGKKKTKKINEAYNKYYNPLNRIGEEKEIRIFSFGIYNWSAFKVEKEIKKNISGKELALENIKNIIKIASK